MAKPHRGSLNDRISELEIGGRLYEEHSLEYCRKIQRLCTAQSRRPQDIAHMRFASGLLTAIPAGQIGEVRYLVCVERVQ